ncbi:MAG: DUF2798 domain-containing protein [Acidobacteriota bacterium]|nr:DUF2798 domain-containing protein [Acidobacteriota bacterium]
MKLSQRTAKFLFAPTVALFMSGTMSFVLTVINRGIDANFISRWLTGFGISFSHRAAVSDVCYSARSKVLRPNY